LSKIIGLFLIKTLHYKKIQYNIDDYLVPSLVSSSSTGFSSDFFSSCFGIVAKESKSTPETSSIFFSILSITHVTFQTTLSNGFQMFFVFS
jgi:hypothetical protein